MGARSARPCSRPLSSAHLGTVLTWTRAHSCRPHLPETFLGVKGSPVQIRPSRLVRASFRTQKQDRERLMVAQHAPISPVKPAVVQRMGDITPLVIRGLPSSPKASPCDVRPQSQLLRRVQQFFVGELSAAQFIQGSRETVIRGVELQSDPIGVSEV